MSENTVSASETKRQLSPSAAARWMACPGSEYIIPSLPKLPPSDAAEEGTLAHTFAAHAVCAALTDATGYGPAGDPPPEPEYALATEDMIDGAQVYADAVCAACGKAFGGAFFWGVERWVGSLAMSIRGRLDFAAWSSDTVLVVDYKFGGEHVPAVGNPQLICYAICVVSENILRYGHAPKRVVVGIVQPRTELADFSMGSVWRTYSYAEFMEEYAKVQEGARQAIGADEKTLRKTGPHCRWCPARSVCRAAIGERLLLAGIAAGEAEMSEDATDEQIGAWLDALRGMDTVRDDLTRIAKARISSGAKIPGWRLSNRKGKAWSQEIRDAGDVRAQASALALALGGEPSDYISEKLATPASVGKSVPKEALADVTEDSVTVALVSDGGRR